MTCDSLPQYGHPSNTDCSPHEPHLHPASSASACFAINSTNADRVSFRRAASVSIAAKIPASIERFALAGRPVSRTSGTKARLAPSPVLAHLLCALHVALELPGVAGNAGFKAQLPEQILRNPDSANLLTAVDFHSNRGTANKLSAPRRAASLSRNTRMKPGGKNP